MSKRLSNALSLVLVIVVIILALLAVFEMSRLHRLLDELREKINQDQELEQSPVQEAQYEAWPELTGAGTGPVLRV